MSTSILMWHKVRRSTWRSSFSPQLRLMLQATRRAWKEVLQTTCQITNIHHWPAARAHVRCVKKFNKCWIAARCRKDDTIRFNCNSWSLWIMAWWIKRISICRSHETSKVWTNQSFISQLCHRKCRLSQTLTSTTWTEMRVLSLQTLPRTIFRRARVLHRTFRLTDTCRVRWLVIWIWECPLVTRATTLIQIASCLLRIRVLIRVITKRCLPWTSWSLRRHAAMCLALLINTEPRVMDTILHRILTNFHNVPYFLKAVCQTRSNEQAQAIS